MIRLTGLAHNLGSVTTRSNSAINVAFGKAGKRSLCSASAEYFSVLVGIPHRVRNQCPEAFPLERKQILARPGVMSQQLRFAHVAAFERYTECLKIQYLWLSDLT